MTCGFLYILSNPNMPGLIKVGKTTRDPSERVKELSSATGVPTPFLLVYYQPVADCDAAESWAHLELERRGYRPNADREFFMAPVHEAVEVLNAARSVMGLAEVRTFDLNRESPSDTNDNALADELFQLALSYLDGTDSMLANPRKALKLLEQASALGHADAAHAAGSIYRWGRDPVPQDLERSLEYHKKAVAGGTWTSLALIANIFEEAGQQSAAEKHWVLFFDNAVDAYLTADADWRLEIIASNVGMYGSWYCQSASKGLIRAVVHPEKLAVCRDALINFHEKTIASFNNPNSGLLLPYQRSLSFLRNQLASIDTATS